MNDWERSLIDEVPDGSAYRTKVVPVKLAIDQWYLERSSPVTDALVAVTLVRRFLPGTESTTLKVAVFAAVPEAAVVRDFIRERKRRMQRPQLAAPGLITFASRDGAVAPRLVVLDGRSERRPHVRRAGERPSRAPGPRRRCAAGRPRRRSSW